jgi:hypothetical protein
MVYFVFWGAIVAMATAAVAVPTTTQGSAPTNSQGSAPNILNFDCSQMPNVCKNMCYGRVTEHTPP